MKPIMRRDSAIEPKINAALISCKLLCTAGTAAVWVLRNWGPTILLASTNPKIMNLQLPNRSLQNPMGLLEHITIESYGIKYEHTFAKVKFGKNTNYKTILGRSFMRQFKII